MKRLLATILALTLMLCAVSALGEEGTYRYDIDFRFEMDAQAYPFRMREHMRGYEELLEILELRGSVIWSPRFDGFNIRTELIPLTDSSASIPLRIFGRPSDVCIETELLGDEPYFLGNTHMLMAFASQFWLATGVRLPSLGLLNPFLAIYATKNEVSAWTGTVPEIRKGTRITVKQLQKVCDAWKELLQTDEDFLLWMDGFYAQMNYPTLLEETLQQLPDVLLNAAGGKDLTVTEEDGILVCRNAAGMLVFRMITGEDGQFVEFAPENTGTAYTPYFCYRVGTESGRRELTLQISLTRSPEVEEERVLPDTLLYFSMEISGIPEKFPGETELTANVSTGGVALSETNLRIALHMTADGETEILVTDPETIGEAKPLFRAYGTVTPVEYDSEQEGYIIYEYDEIAQYPRLLVASYKTIGELSDSIVPVFIRRVIDLLYALPVRACQSIMDDLENAGLLEPILSGID